MEALVEWKSGLGFEATPSSGHMVIMDASPDAGGGNRGARPMEMLLMGMGGCTGVDVVLILQKARAEISTFRIELSASRAASPPRVFTNINVHYVLSGRNIRETAVKRAIDLTAEKYCSASIMFGKTAEITHSYEILDTNSASAEKG